VDYILNLDFFFSFFSKITKYLNLNIIDIFKSIYQFTWLFTNPSLWNDTKCKILVYFWQSKLHYNIKLFCLFFTKERNPYSYECVHHRNQRFKFRTTFTVNSLGYRGWFRSFPLVFEYGPGIFRLGWILFKVNSLGFREWNAQ
jgi:hypothetical protein